MPFNKKALTDKQQKLVRIIMEGKPNTPKELDALDINDEDLTILQEVKWKDFDIRNKNIAIMELASSLVAKTLQIRKKDQKHKKDSKAYKKVRNSKHNFTEDAEITAA